ncbi:MAG: hypothetical protein PUG48_05225 [Clostridia bacterium]|nr:hypothetical protein [Clostridia bacterium]
MLLAIISAVVCLAIATMMYTPRMRSFRFYRPVAFLFLFEGIWVLADYIFRQISPDNVFMQIIHYVGLIVLGMYFLIKLFFSDRKKEKSIKEKK